MTMETDQAELAIVGELQEQESELHEKLLDLPEGGECRLFFNSPGGDPYCGLSLMSIILLRRLRCTGIVTGECSSAALWVWAACTCRQVLPHSVLLFHPLRWESGENIQQREAAEWARHFARFNEQSDQLLAHYLGLDADLLHQWTTSSRFVTGPEIAATGCAQLIALPGGMTL